MSHKKNIKYIFLILLILNLLLNIFILLNQIYQIDNITYTVIKIILIVIIIIAFYKKKYLRNLKMIFYLGFVIILVVLFIQGINIYQNNKISIEGEIKCDGIKRSLFEEEGYRYESNCNYYKTIIKIGKKNYTFYEIVNLKKDKIDYIVKVFKLEKKKNRKKVYIETTKEKKTIFVKKERECNYYYYGIKSLNLLYNGKKYNLADEDYPLNVEFFLELKKIDRNYHAWYTGKYYNMVSCFRGRINLVDCYILPKSIKITEMEQFCKDRKEIN